VTPAPPQVPPGHARATIDSVPPGARATIDGHVIGVTPAVANVAHGKHTLVLELAGYQRLSQPLEIHAAERAVTVAPRLVREGGGAAPAVPHKGQGHPGGGRAP
jgi:hypothetical protein